MILQYLNVWIVQKQCTGVIVAQIHMIAKDAIMNMSFMSRDASAVRIRLKLKGVQVNILFMLDCSSLCNRCLWNTDTCMDCYESHHRYLSNFECVCDYNYYADEGDICLECYPLCRICSGGYNGSCEECIVDDSVDTINNGYCNCSENHEYYEDVGRCLLICGVGE